VHRRSSHVAVASLRLLGAAAATKQQYISRGFMFLCVCYLLTEFEAGRWPIRDRFSCSRGECCTTNYHAPPRSQNP
jgi:hypothetical protein